MDLYLTAAFTWILTMILFLAQTSASGYFQVQLLSFNNGEGLNASEGCCSGVRNSTTGQNRTTTQDGTPPCSSLCRRTYFRICFSHYQASIPEDPVCTYGIHTTAVLAAGSTFHSVGEGKSPANGSGHASAFGQSAGDITFPFTFTWPGTFSLIVEALHEEEEEEGTTSGIKGSPSNLIARVAIQRSKDPGEDWQELIHVNGSIRMVFRYRVTCSNNYYGSGCSEICKPRDDKFGHYICRENGSKICLQGWTGQYCDKALCLTGCNEKTGYCEEPNECRCRLGWQGPTCDSCIPYPGCQHGICQEPWECTCQEGWGGLFCNQDLNFCTNYRPCLNGATCMNAGKGSYTCVCPSGFTGTNCEIEVNDCRPASRSCLNEGLCTRIAANEFECRCTAGLYGRRCEQRLATGCEEKPCRNSGSCIQMPGIQKYQCSCPEGFTGVNCEHQLDECKSQPCYNGGSCIDEFNGFQCICPSGFRGFRCQENYNECAVNPCLNGGVCIDKVDAFECRCQPGFVGPLCLDDVDECLQFPCANGAVCRDLPNGFECKCTPGFTGKFCTVKVDTCTSRPCLNGATCEGSVNSYQCTCASGYYGRHCEFTRARDIGSRLPSTSGLASAPEATPSSNDKSTDLTVSQNSIDANSGNVQSLINASSSSLTIQQLVLIACLGVGLPVMLMLAVILFLILRKHRRDLSELQQTSAQQENEDNQTKRLNNKNACLEQDSENMPENSIYLNLIDSKQTQRSSSKSRPNNSQNINADVHKNYSRKQNNLRRVTSKDIDFEV